MKVTKYIEKRHALRKIKNYGNRIRNKICLDIYDATRNTN